MPEGPTVVLTLDQVTELFLWGTRAGIDSLFKGVSIKTIMNHELTKLGIKLALKGREEDSMSVVHTMADQLEGEI